MKARLLYPDSDFDWRLVQRAAEAREDNRERSWRRDNNFDESMGLPWNERVLSADLSLETLFEAMAGKDDCIYESVKRVTFTSLNGNLDTITYRQGVLEDSLKHPSDVRKLYALTVKALKKQREHYMSDYIRNHADSMLRESIGIIQDLLDSLRELHGLAELYAPRFHSPGWIQFFTMLKHDLGDDYLNEIEHHLKELDQRHESLLLSVKLGEANKGQDYSLLQSPHDHKGWWHSLLPSREPVHSFKLHPRDEAGSQALNELRDRGTGSVASAVGESAENISDFFSMLQVELGFYVGCINLHEKMTAKGEPTCIPAATKADIYKLSTHGLYDIGLSLTVDKRVVGNTVNADNKSLVIITGANTGGKSTFLRSVGLAQLMMQSGMFVPATSFTANVCSGVFTHYKREEDTEMDSGKFDEELSRMSEIVDHLRPGALMLFNESFAATNEREGSEVARQIITALQAEHIKVVCVTHLYELAHGFYEHDRKDALFLRAGHKTNGERTFKMIEEEPLPTSHGDELYKRIFHN